jgi:hypothetical protein
MRKHCKRRVWVPMPPRGLRPKLSRPQVKDLGLCHLTNLDVIAKGEATEDTLWQVAGGALTWSRVAELLQAGEPEMREQLELVARLVDRYGRTGRVLFTGTEYQLAKDGVGVMDQLAEIVDLPTAVIAAEWSEQRVNEMAEACRAREAVAA